MPGQLLCFLNTISPKSLSSVMINAPKFSESHITSSSVIPGDNSATEYTEIPASLKLDTNL